MIQRTVTIENELGLHARAAAKLVRIASKFRSDIKLTRAEDDHQIDGKSILGILLLAAAKGTQILFTFNGPDEKIAADEVVELIETKFGEER
jgi:phosphocarrier protein